jgi:hypothetical protein
MWFQYGKILALAKPQCASGMPANNTVASVRPPAAVAQLICKDLPVKAVAVHLLQNGIGGLLLDAGDGVEKRVDETLTSLPGSRTDSITSK